MQQDVNLYPNAVPAAPTAAIEPVAAPPQRQIDPAYVANLEARFREQQAELNRYEPFKDELGWIAEDPTRIEGVRRYKSAYEEAARPQIHPDLVPLLDVVRAETAPLKAYVTREENAAQQREAATRQTFINDNIAFAQRLVGEKKITAEQVDGLAAYADSLAHRLQRNVSIEEAYKTGQSAFGSLKTEAAQAPVLRSDAGEIGVPGPSTTDNKAWLSDFSGELVKSLRAAKTA